MVGNESVAREDADTGERSVAKSGNVALLGTDVSTGPPVILLAAEDEGRIIEIVPLGHS